MKRRLPENYPRITSYIYKVRVCYPKTSMSKYVKVRMVAPDYEKIIKKANELVVLGYRILVIFNTVDKATAFFKKIKNSSKFIGYNIALIHSRFPKADRSKLEEYWFTRWGQNSERKVKEYGGGILIGTQVLEQSLDIDADFLITEITPSDFLIQRIGRLWRFPRTTDGKPYPRPIGSLAETLIVCPQLSNFDITSRQELKELFGVNAKIYPEYLLWKTYRIWKRLKALNTPGDVGDIIERTYSEVKTNDPLWVKECFEAFELSKKQKESQADMATGSYFEMDNDEEDFTPVDVVEEDYAPTRRSSVPTRQLLLTNSGIVSYSYNRKGMDFLDGTSFTYSPRAYKKLTRETLMNQLVKVPITSVLENKDGILTPEWLQNVLYGYPIPVKVEDLKVKLLNGKETGYFYEKDCGIHKPQSLK